MAIQFIGENFQPDAAIMKGVNSDEMMGFDKPCDSNVDLKCTAYSIDDSCDDSLNNASWSNFLKHNGDSILIKLFWAQLISVVRCETCGTESSTYDPYSYLSLPLPDASNNASVLDLADCFNQFGEKDYLTGANSYDCEKCERSTSAVRIMGIWSLPQYLLVHLKRFNNRCKDNRRVTFPLDNFRIGQWAKNRDDATYRLISVCCHVGGMQGGHYYAYCRHSNDAWYKYDDTRVTKVNQSELLNLSQQPYYFVYMRK